MEIPARGSRPQAQGEYEAEPPRVREVWIGAASVLQKNERPDSGRKRVGPFYRVQSKPSRIQAIMRGRARGRTLLPGLTDFKAPSTSETNVRIDPEGVPTAAGNTFAEFREASRISSMRL